MKTDDRKSMTNEKKTNGTTIVIIILLIAILVFGAVVSYVLLTKEDNAQIEAESSEMSNINEGRGTIVTPENVDELLNEEKVEEDYFETNMTNEWVFEKGVADMRTFYLKNETTNRHTFFFDIVTDDGNVIYSSPYVPVGAEVPQFTLSTIPEKGDYSASVKYHFVDDEYKEVSSVSIAVTLHIK